MRPVHLPPCLLTFARTAATCSSIGIRPDYGAWLVSRSGRIRPVDLPKFCRAGTTNMQVIGDYSWSIKISPG